MTKLKTTVTKASVSDFLDTIEDAGKQKDARALLKIFKDATGEAPKLWGTNMFGFGLFHYQSTKSAQKGDWFLTGFSPRKQNLTLYIMPGFKAYGDLMETLGKYKISVGCLYIKQLSDVNTTVLTALIKRSVKDMKEKYSPPK